MGLYQDWLNIAQMDRPQDEMQEFWKEYFEIEKQTYKKILASETPITGKLNELAHQFDMESVVMAGFIDGINTSLAAGEYDLDALEEDTDISLEVNLERLYYNMLDAKADWLYELSEWEPLLSADERKAITKKFRADKVFIAAPKAGRNEPCPCGSGKKYKNCCGKNS